MSVGISDGQFPKDKPKLVISIKGGNIIRLSSDQPEFFEKVDIIKVDYDIENFDEDKLSDTPSAVFLTHPNWSYIENIGKVDKLDFDLPEGF